MAAPQPQGGARTVFALTPGQASGNQLLDYSTPDGVKHYQVATASLYGKDDDNKFDCNAAGLRDFLQLLETRSNSYAWDVAVLDVCLDPTDLVNSSRINLLTNHGEITLEQVKAHVQAYINGQTRAAQDSMQVYQCMMNSLSKIGREKITVWRDQYHVGSLPSGALLLKIIIRESHSDTQAQTAYIRNQLSSLDTYMESVGSDVEKFNIHVRSLVQQLKARGETTQDLLVNLFKGYKAAQDSKFVEYIEKREDEYEDGENITEEMLMTKAANKYKTLMLKEKWMAPSAHEEKVLALEAKIKSMAKKKGTNAPVPNKQKTDSNKGKTKKGLPDKPTWMTKEPQNKKESKRVNGKDYYWCPNHKSWTRHKPSECKGKGSVTNKNNKEGGGKAMSKSKRELKLAKAAELLQEETDE